MRFLEHIRWAAEHGRLNVVVGLFANCHLKLGTIIMQTNENVQFGSWPERPRGRCQHDSHQTGTLDLGRKKAAEGLNTLRFASGR